MAAAILRINSSERVKKKPEKESLQKGKRGR